MPIRRRRAPRRRRALRKRGKRSNKARVPRGITTTDNQYCKVVETVAIQDILPGIQAADSFSLMLFQRARYMAVGFKHYKAAKCTWTYEPLYNTFADDAAAPGDTIPYIYTAMNRTGDAVAPVNLLSLQAMGAKPVKFNKKFSVSYKPNWNTPGLPVILSSNTSSDKTQVMLGSKAEYGWIDSSPYRSKNTITTNFTGTLIPLFPSTLEQDVQAPTYTASAVQNASYDVLYNGHITIFEQQVKNPDVRPIGKLTLTVTWLFKTPVWFNQTTQQGLS